jgi:flagellar hook-associated protein 2
MMNPKSIASQFAMLDVQSQVNQLNRQQTTINNDSAALTSLQTALTDFKTAIDALNSSTTGVLINSATLSNDTMATVSADSTAQPGSYTFYVETLASAQQYAYQGLQEGDIPTSGVITLSLGSDPENSMSLDLAAIDSNGDGQNSLAEFSSAINSSPDNPGVTASLVKSEGQTTLLLTSDETGAANTISLVATNVPTGAFTSTLAAPTELATASDALIYLGGDPSTGIPISNSSNTFDDLIEGVSITFSEVNTSGTPPLTINISTDESASQAQVQTFIDAYNALFDALDVLTNSGGEGDDVTRGALAGDAGVSSLENQIKSAIRQDYDGVSLMDYGVSVDTEGHLSLDSTQFNEMMETNSQGLSAIFVGNNSLVAKLDQSLETFLDADTGIITQRQASLDASQEQLDNNADEVQSRYDSAYNRYLSEYTALLITITEMQTSMAAFS